MVRRNPKLINLDGLEGVTGITGASNNGYSLQITYNDALTAISGLRGLKGVLPGMLNIHSSPELTSVSGIEGITGVGTTSDGGEWSLYISTSPKLCLSEDDRARLTTGIVISGGGSVTVPDAQWPVGSGCTACEGGFFSVGGASACLTSNSSISPSVCAPPTKEPTNSPTKTTDPPSPTHEGYVGTPGYCRDANGTNIWGSTPGQDHCVDDVDACVASCVGWNPEDGPCRAVAAAVCPAWCCDDTNCNGTWTSCAIGQTRCVRYASHKNVVPVQGSGAVENSPRRTAHEIAPARE